MCLPGSIVAKVDQTKARDQVHEPEDEMSSVRPSQLGLASDHLNVSGRVKDDQFETTVYQEGERDCDDFT
jgi:hypothetical protein